MIKIDSDHIILFFLSLKNYSKLIYLIDNFIFLVTNRRATNPNVRVQSQSSVIFNSFVKSNGSKLRQSVSRPVIKAPRNSEKMNPELTD